jgi:hypothetical protein
MINWLLKLLDKRSEDEFYGSVTIYFQNGKITHVDEKTTHKPPLDLN